MMIEMITHSLLLPKPNNRHARPQKQATSNHSNTAQRHSQRSPSRVQPNMRARTRRNRIQNTRRNRQSNNVVQRRPEEIENNPPEDHTAKRHQRENCAQVRVH
jgi:hypothetical protein